MILNKKPQLLNLQLQQVINFDFYFDLIILLNLATPWYLKCVSDLTITGIPNQSSVCKGEGEEQYTFNF